MLQEAPHPLSFTSTPPCSSGIENLELPDLMKNPHVRELFNKWTEANQRTVQHTETQSKLLNQINVLQNEIHSLRGQVIELQKESKM